MKNNKYVRIRISISEIPYGIYTLNFRKDLRTLWDFVYQAFTNSNKCMKLQISSFHEISYFECLGSVRKPFIF